jgi:polar amino acid transport system permease protein
MDINFVWEHFPALLRGAKNTLVISLILLVLVNAVGIAGALARTSQVQPLRWITAVYVEIARNVPELVQIYFVFFVFPSLGLKFSAYVSGIIAMTFFGGGYFIEVYRSGLEAVPKTQHEAASSLALNGYQRMRYVIFPQAVRICLPALNGYFLYLVRSTSLLAAIGIAESTFAAVDLISQYFHAFELFTAVAVIYLLLVWSLTFLLRLLERKFKYEL